MYLSFNEISLRPFAESSHMLILNFFELINIFKKLKYEYKFTHLIFPSNLSQMEVLPNLTIYQWLNELSGLDKQQILSLISRKPFSHDIMFEDKEVLDYYVFGNEDLEVDECICIGLGLADIFQTASISLNTNDFWRNDNISFDFLDYTTEEKKPIIAPNCCLLEITDEFKLWAEKFVEVILITTNVEPSSKPINLKNDHGKDILYSFAKRLRMSNHIVSVINSLPFNPTTSRFIRKCYPDGKIEVVLHWEDSGIGMLIQTTGRTYNETVAIATILKNKYDI